ncbi:hypothetical protein Ais01nite_62940 [Asanoa ishikariensis]|nr:hypothetical protein Ais01nite_62940 [Asanoa ishikariensis]
MIHTTRDNVVNRGWFDERAWHPSLLSGGPAPARDTGMPALWHLCASALLDGGESIKSAGRLPRPRGLRIYPYGPTRT